MIQHAAITSTNAFVVVGGGDDAVVAAAAAVVVVVVQAMLKMCRVSRTYKHSTVLLEVLHLTSLPAI